MRSVVNSLIPEVSLTSGGQDPLKLVTIYRPPPNSANASTSSKFFDEFSALLEAIDLTSGHFILCGDFNIHVDNDDSPDAKTLTDMLDSCAATQHVHEATHSKGHTLDLVITSEADNFVSNLSVLNTFPSDHSAICFDVDLSRPLSSKRKVSFRKLKDIDFASFKEDIANLSVITDPSENVDTIVRQYNTDLGNLLDKHAPVTTRKITLRPNAPWYDESLRNLKREKKILRAKMEEN